MTHEDAGLVEGEAATTGAAQEEIESEEVTVDGGNNDSGGKGSAEGGVGTGVGRERVWRTVPGW